jgi:hypothetical protein
MKTGPLEKGDRVDYRDHRDGEVLRVGRATVWAVFNTPHGNFPVSAPLADFKRHIVPQLVRIGEYGLRVPGSKESKVQIHWARTGEMMETEAATLETVLARFFRREF